jgi:tRNA threonylcarbamoyladenosine biosynthesis protein TsaB
LNKDDIRASEPLILAIDTSSKATSIALRRGAKSLKSISAPAAEKRSEKLWSEVQALLEDLGLTIRDVDVFAVCVGPGGFTGLRIGMAAVKGFAAATNKPIVGVTSLEAAAMDARSGSPVCAMVNAYKGEVYSQLFLFTDDGMPMAQNRPMVSTFEKALERVADLNDLVFVGDGAEAGKEVIARVRKMSAEDKGAIGRSERSIAEHVAELALLRHASGETKTAESLTACYVRPAEAEIKLSQGLLGSKIKRSMKAE